MGFKVGAALAAAAVSGVVFSSPARALSESQEAAACQGDAIKLCSPYIPDRAKIRNCLVSYRDYLSPACRAIVAPGKKKRS
ncbi:hypothetical protein [Methylocella sp.]|uniref:hypothetical protein n=1 Tax=Methylocella sp. TaxID=1978226 RepID=UPI003782F24C